MNKDLLIAGRPDFKNACEYGLTYFCMHWQSAYVWPKLPSVAEKVLNTQAKGESIDIEGMLSLLKAVSGELAAGTELEHIGF